MKTIRIGGGAGYGGDRIEPALDLIRFGNLDYIIFECLAERTIAIAQQEKEKDSKKGYNELLEYRMSRILPLLKEHKVKIITIWAQPIRRPLCKQPAGWRRNTG